MQGVHDSRRVFQIQPEVSLGVALPRRWSAFVEYFSTLRARGRPDEHSLDGGFAWLASDDVQLDASAGVGLSEAAPDLFVDVGIACRLPRLFGGAP